MSQSLCIFLYIFVSVSLSLCLSLCVCLFSLSLSLSICIANIKVAIEAVETTNKLVENAGTEIKQVAENVKKFQNL